MRLKLIGCEVLYRELCAAVSRSINQVDVEFLPKGLHDKGGAGMLARLQPVLDQVDGARYEAVLFGYALCGNGTAGLVTRNLPLVIPRAHDCITLLVGGRERYLEYFTNHPGVYFRSSGWIERGQDAGSQLSLTLDDLAARFGEEAARYLHQELTKHYRQLTFIETGLEPDGSLERQAQLEAAGHGWSFEKVQGDMGLIQRLVDGPWDEDRFLTVPPGSRIVATHDEKVLGVEKA